VLPLIALSACGDDPPKTVANVTVTGVAGTPAAKHAVELMPDLSSLGFTAAGVQRPTASTNFQDVAIQQYTKTGAPPMGARVEISVLEDAATATQRFSVLSEALRNPPPDLFGPDSQQNDTATTGVGDQGKSFKTAKPDAQGNYVWSDSYRFKNAFVIVYLLSNDDAAALKMRTSIAQQIEKLAQ
jgi:hypothetical protein